MKFNHDADSIPEAIGVSHERSKEIKMLAAVVVTTYIEAGTGRSSFAYESVHESGLTGVEALLLFDYIRRLEEGGCNL